MGGENKLLRPICGKNAIVRCMEALGQEPRLATIVLVVSGEVRSEAQRIIREWEMRHSGANRIDASEPLRLILIEGGDNRGESVRKGLEALSEDEPELVAIHDAARIMVTQRLLSRCLDCAAEHGSGIAGIPVVDTLRHVNVEHCIDGNLERDGVWQMQTPQCFAFDKIRQAYQVAQERGIEATDDATVYALLGTSAQMVSSLDEEVDNFKLTLPGDLRRAERMIQRAAGEQHMQKMRIGWGEDTHRLQEGRALILGGIKIPFQKGLLGHSDADVLCHAVSDAMLGALALGDIGQHFPDTDPQYAGADSIELLQKVYAIVRAKGFSLANVDATITAEKPKLSTSIPAMQKRLSEALGVENEAISIKATTGEGLGAEGRGEAITVRCVLLLERCS